MAAAEIIAFRVGESNYNYLLHAHGEKRALAVDPFDARRVYNEAGKRGLKISWILNTHGHWDHVQGNEELLRLTGASLAASEHASIDGVSKKLHDGEDWEVEGMRLKILYTPGHIPDHLCAVVDERLLLSGDTLFLGGCGNCKFGGDADRLFDSLKTLSALPPFLFVYCGHDYNEKNLRFCAQVEPDNLAVAQMQQRCRSAAAEKQILVSTLGEEKSYNVLLRAAVANDRERFKMLRTKRDTF